jgi:hypothetical protein
MRLYIVYSNTKIACHKVVLGNCVVCFEFEELILLLSWRQEFTLKIWSLWYKKIHTRIGTLKEKKTIKNAIDSNTI